MPTEESVAMHERRADDRKAEPPAGYAIALRLAEELDAGMARAFGCEEAPRPSSVEDEIAVGEVVQDPGVVRLRPLDGLLEEAFRDRGGGPAPGPVQIHRVGRDVGAGVRDVRRAC